MDNDSAERPRMPVQKRLHDGFRADRRYLTQMLVESKDATKDRVEAVLELKRDMDTSSAQIGAQSCAIRAKTQAENVAQMRSHQNLVDQGKNPYELARRKVVKREARKERAKINRNIQEKQAKLLAKLEAEKVRDKRRKKVEDQNRAFARKYQREMGQAAQEERTNTYLLSRTGKEALDPTGKVVRVYPSQETTIKDHSFGLGRSAKLTAEHRRKIAAKICAKPTHFLAQPISMLLSRRTQEFEREEFASSEEDLECKKLAQMVMSPLPSVQPGQEVLSLNHSFLSDVKLPPIDGKNTRKSLNLQKENEIGDDFVDSSKCKKFCGRSVLEEKQLMRSRLAQKESLFAQKQVVWGKTFGGNAFLANPQILWFQDFAICKSQILTFTLTNISNTFNQFRLLPMDDEISDLFEIKYEKPGRMSAGMSCSLRMIFTGIEPRDFETSLSVAAPTGVFQILVRCTCKKAVPVVIKREIQFPEVVAGERTTIALVLGNEGALPLEFCVRRLLSTPVTQISHEGLEKSENGEKCEILEAANEDNVEIGDEVEEVVDGNPQEENIEENTEEIGDIVTEMEQEETRNSRSASRTTSAKSTKTSTTQAKTLEEDDELLSPEEEELVEKVFKTMQFKTDTTDEPIHFIKTGTVDPYSTSSISFTFAPSTALKLENEQFLLEFPSNLELAPIPIFVSGISSQVPMFVANSRLNFRCCAYGKLYRHQLEVCNRGKVALKIQVQVPKCLAGFIEFNPKFGFVQAGGKFIIQVKFQPQEKIWKRIERAGFGSQQLGIFAVPVSISVPDQVVPVSFLLTARLTSTKVQFLDFLTEKSKKEVNFGICSVGHSVSQNLTIVNAARVPQRVGITNLPKDVTIADISGGVGLILLSGESKTLKLVYEPSFPGILKAAGRENPKLTLWSSTFHQKYTISCLGSSVVSDLLFSHTALRLGATSIGQLQTCNLNLTNRSERYTQLVELRVPPEAVHYLRITPLVVRLEPQKTVRLEIDFEPTENIFKLVENCCIEGNLTGNVKLAEEEDKEFLGNLNSDKCDSEVQKLADEPRSCHHKWTILCFHQREDKNIEKHFVKVEKPPLQALEIRTTVVEPSLIPSTDIVDFGQVAIGQTLFREIILETSGLTENIKLRAQPLHILGAYRLIGALREVPANSKRKKSLLRVEFEPQCPLKYEDELELSALGVNIRIRLRGEGINPCLSLTPADGKVDFQDVLARTRNVRDLVLKNGSAFPLAFSFVPVSGDNNENFTVTNTGLPIFTFSPTTAIISENGSVNVQVVFQPDHQRSSHYAQQFRIKVPNESEHHVVNVSGRCWENQLYVFTPSAEFLSENVEISTKKQLKLAPQPVEDPFDLPPSISLTQLPSNFGNELPFAGLRKPPSILTLTFVSEDTGVIAGDNSEVDTLARVTKTLIIGSTVPSSGNYGGYDETSTVNTATTGGSAGSFELTMDATSPHVKLFTLEPSRGAIAAGQQLAIQVSFYPPLLTVASAFGSEVQSTGTLEKTAKQRPEFEVVQWVQVKVQCTLKGGSLWRSLPPVGAPVPVPVVATDKMKGMNAGTGASDGSDTRIVTVILKARLET